MTTAQAKQVHAHMILTSAFYHLVGDFHAGLAILDARTRVVEEMDSDTLMTAINLSCEMDYFGRAA
jgi:hypothetical protein